MPVHQPEGVDRPVVAPADCRCMTCTVQKIIAHLQPSAEAARSDADTLTLSFDPDFAYRAMINVVGILGSRMDDIEFSQLLLAMDEERESARAHPALWDDQLN